MQNLVRVALALCALCAGAEAGAQQTGPPASIRVTGNASVTANPDRAYVDVGVMTQASQSQAAVTLNATKLSAVLKSLRQTLGASADIRTTSYTLNADYQYHPAGGQPTIGGYTASNVIRVTIDELGKVGMVIDAAIQAGANQVPDIRFALKDEQAVRGQALEAAARKARSEAQVLAGALGLKVSRVLLVEEGGPAAIPIRGVMYARGEPKAASTPIEPGGLEVVANVTLTVEVTAR